MRLSSIDTRYFKAVTAILIASISAFAGASEPQATSMQKISVLGGFLEFENPQNYCTVGDSPREEALLIRAKADIPDSIRILHTSVFCPELKAYISGDTNEITRWTQIQLLGSSGGFQRISIPRESFLQAVGREARKLSSAQIEKEIKERVDSDTFTISGLNKTVLGRDRDAVYTYTVAHTDDGDSARTVHGLGAATLIDSIPIGIHVYSSSAASDTAASLRSVQQTLLQSLLTQ